MARAVRERRALGGKSVAEAQRQERAGEDRRWHANVGEEVRGARGIIHRHVNHSGVVAGRWRQQERKERKGTTNDHGPARAKAQTLFWPFCLSCNGK